MKPSSLFLILALGCTCSAVAEEQPTDDDTKGTTATTEAEPDCDQHADPGLLAAGLQLR